MSRTSLRLVSFPSPSVRLLATPFVRGMLSFSARDLLCLKCSFTNPPKHHSLAIAMEHNFMASAGKIAVIMMFAFACMFKLDC